MSSNSVSGIIQVAGKQEGMDSQTIERLANKNEQQTLIQDLQQYRL
jgi:hypothetical protein